MSDLGHFLREECVFGLGSSGVVSVFEPLGREIAGSSSSRRMVIVRSVIVGVVGSRDNVSKLED